jgi:hypothetical protein
VKKLLLAGMAFGLVAAAGSASAADIPLKALTLPPPAFFSWTGFYGGTTE